MRTGLSHANNLIGCGGSTNKSDWATRASRRAHSGACGSAHGGGGL